MGDTLSQLAGPKTMNTGSGPMPYPAPVGTPGGNALIDWLGAGNMPSIPNPNTFGQLFAGGGNSGGGGNQGGGNSGDIAWASRSGPMPPAGFTPSPQQPFPQVPSLISGGYYPSLPNPDIGTFGGGQGSIGQPQPVHSIPGLKLPQMGGKQSNGKF